MSENSHKIIQAKRSRANTSILSVLVFQLISLNSFSGTLGEQKPNLFLSQKDVLDLVKKEEKASVGLLNRLSSSGYLAVEPLVQVKVGFEFYKIGNKIRLNTIPTAIGTPESVKVAALYNSMLDSNSIQSGSDFKKAVGAAQLSFAGLSDLLVLVGGKFQDGYDNGTGLKPSTLDELIRNAQAGKSKGGICGDIHMAMAEIAEAGGGRAVDSTVVFAKWGKVSHKTLMLFNPESKRYVWFNYGADPVEIAKKMQNKEMVIDVLARAMGGYTQSVGVQEVNHDVYTILTPEGQWVGSFVREGARYVGEGPHLAVSATNQSQDASINFALKNVQLFLGYHRFTSRYAFQGVDQHISQRDAYQLALLGVSYGGQTVETDIRLPGGLVIPRVQVEGDIHAGLLYFDGPNAGKSSPEKYHGFIGSRSRVGTRVLDRTRVSLGTDIETDDVGITKTDGAPLGFPYNKFDLMVEQVVLQYGKVNAVARAQVNAEVNPSNLRSNSPNVRARDVNVGMNVEIAATEKLLVYFDGAIYGIHIDDGVGVDLKAGARYVIGDTRVIQDITLSVDGRYKAVVANPGNVRLLENVSSKGIYARLQGKLAKFLPYMDDVHIFTEFGVRTQRPSTAFGNDIFERNTPDVVDGLEPYVGAGIEVKSPRPPVPMPRTYPEN